MTTEPRIRQHSRPNILDGVTKGMIEKRSSRESVSTQAAQCRLESEPNNYNEVEILVRKMSPMSLHVMSHLHDIEKNARLGDAY